MDGTGHVDDKGNDGGSDHARRMILVEDVRNVVHGENTSRSSPRCFHWENIHRSTEKPPMGVVDGTMESVHSSDGRARNVHLVRVEKLHMAHDDCRSYFRDRTIHCTQRFRNEEEMGRCSVLGGEDLHNAERLES